MMQQARNTIWIGSLLGEVHASDDFNNNMQASVPEDMIGIKSLILQEFDSVQEFNASLKTYIKTATSNSSSWDSDSPTWGGGDGDGGDG
eukprot:1575410-Rhodomonas_salina.1